MQRAARVRVSATDAALGALATLVGLVSLTYPFGRDQGLFFYVGREWLLRGSIPYRDVWDHKPPLIYLTHALSIALFGEHMWTIRATELVLVGALGWVASRVATPFAEPVRPGAWGAAWLSASIAYFGCLGFWDTAQCEIWYATFGLASLAAVLRLRTERGAALWGGVLGGISLWYKPPAVFFVLVAMAALLFRATREDKGLSSARRVLYALFGYAAGIALVSALLLAYFAWHGAVDEMTEILVGANAYYVQHELPSRELASFLFAFGVFHVFGPLLAILLGGSALVIAWNIARGHAATARRYGLVVSLVAATAAAVLVQLKLYIYHWGPLAAAASVFGAAAYRDAASLAARLPKQRLATRAVPAAFALIAFALFNVGSSSAHWWNANSAALAHLQGSMSRRAFARTFDMPFQTYYYADSERVASWLRENARPEDTLAVRRFEPQIYAASGLHHTGRFFWTMFLTDTRRAYERARWWREDQAVFRERPPSFVVAMFGAPDPIDRCSWFTALGYRRVKRVGVFCILQRG